MLKAEGTHFCKYHVSLTALLRVIRSPFFIYSVIFYFKTSRRISGLGNPGYPVLCFGVGRRPTDLRTQEGRSHEQRGGSL